MMNPAEIRQSLQGAFPDAQIMAEDSTGGGDHFAVHITSASFAGCSLVERHQMVYRALGSLMPRIHALQLKTDAPGES
jgi:stress-induced morphogen